MKKISALLLIFVLLLQMCLFNASAKEAEIVKIYGHQYTAGAPSEYSVEKQEAMVRTGGRLDYAVDLKTEVASIKLEYSTGGSSRGVIDIKLNDTIVATLDTTILPDTWARYTYVVSLPEPIVGKNTVSIVCHGGAHIVKNWTFLPFDNSIRFAVFNVKDNFIDIEKDANRHEINLLSDLELIKEKGTTFKPDIVMSRVVFVSILGRLLEAEKYAEETSPFKDVDVKDEHAAILSGLYQLGIIKGDTEGNFRPHDFITPLEAATVCANALGYKGYKNALDIAYSLKLFKGLSLKSNVITRSEGIKIIYNLLLADYLAVSEMYEDAILYNPARNFIEKSSKFFHGTGVMTANNVTELYKRKNSEQIEIAGIKYHLFNSNMAVDFLGMNCEFFYIEKDGERYLYTIRPLPKVEVNVIESDKNVRFDEISDKKLVYTYINEDEEIEYELDALTAVIYNATAVKKSLSRLIPDPEEFEGRITTVDNNGDGILEAIWIDHISRVIKNETVVGTKIKDEVSQTFYDTAEGEFNYFVGDRLAELDELALGDMISLYESSDTGKNKITRAIKNETRVTGTVKMVEDGIYTINDEKFKISSKCGDDIYLGLTGTFILDQFDHIISYTESEETENRIGAYISYAQPQPNSLMTSAMLKLLTEDGIKIFTVAPRVYADGILIKKIDDFYNGTTTFTGMVNVESKSPVIYRLNAAGEISMIDTINDGAKDDNDQLVNLISGVDANPINTVTMGSYRYYSSVFVDAKWKSRYAVTSGAKLIAFTTDNNEENFAILNGYSCEADAFGTVAVYSTTGKARVADIVLTRSYAMTTNRATKPFVFKSLNTKINNDGDAAFYINGVASTEDVSYEISSDSYSSDANLRTVLASLKEGDLVRALMTNSKATSLELIYIPDAVANAEFGPSSNGAGVVTLLNNDTRSVGSSNGSGAIVLGKIVDVEGTFLTMNIQTKQEGVWTDDYWTFNAGSAQVVICEKTQSGKYILTGSLKLPSLVKDDIVVGLRGSNGVLSAVYVFRDNSR